MIDATVAPQVGLISPFVTTACNVNHSNARINPPPATSYIAGDNLRRGTLRAVGLYELWGGALQGQRYYPKIPKMSHVPCHSDNRFSSIA
jgi:hypothetical protein